MPWVPSPHYPASIFLALLTTQRQLSFTHLIPRPHLEHSEDLTSSSVVPLIVLKAPGVGEEQVISDTLTMQCHPLIYATFCWDTCTNMSTIVTMNKGLGKTKMPVADILAH